MGVPVGADLELPERTAETTDIFEIMHTMRAMRRLKSNPVPDELIRKILLAGQAAANGRQHPALAFSGAEKPSW
jgi:nitroreductase